MAFGVGEGLSEELGSAVSNLGGSALSLLDPADYHVTLKFLSEFSSERFFECLPDICALGPPPESSLTAGKLALWPTVLALECEAAPAMVQWQKRLNELLEKKGFLKERHPAFRPHVTLARLKAGAKAVPLEGEGRFAGRIVPLRPPALWRSRPPETGRRHEELLCPLFRTS